MMQSENQAPATREWVEVKIQASLKDYVTREVHDRDFKELREEDKSIRKDFAKADEKASKIASEAKTIASGKVGWVVYCSLQAAIIGGLLAVIWGIFSKAFGATLG